MLLAYYMTNTFPQESLYEETFNVIIHTIRVVFKNKMQSYTLTKRKISQMFLYLLCALIVECL